MMHKRCWILLIAVATLSVADGCSRRVNSVTEISPDSSGVTVRDSEISVDFASDWPWWRGPNGNGVANCQNAPAQWSDRQGIVWQVAVPGRGHCSPIVIGNQVLVATALDSEQRQLIIAFDRATGKENWQTVVHSGGFPSSVELHRKGSNANGTLACDGKLIFSAQLHNSVITASALNLAGERVWQQEIGKFSSKFGYAPSPILYKSLVIFAADNQGGGYITALDRATGKIAWRKARPAIATYSSPAVAKVGGSDQLLISGCRQVCSFDPATGEEIWSCAGTAEATCGTVVWNADHVFASGGFPDRQTLCVDASGSRKVVWSNSSRCYEPSMLIAQERLFAVTDEGIATCWEAASGREIWKHRLGGNFSASPVLCGDLIYVTADNAVTTVFRASSPAFEQVARNKLGDDCYASPAICGGYIFLRVGKQQSGARQEMLVCIGREGISDGGQLQ